jgi:hypothetical protein
MKRQVKIGERLVGDGQIVAAIAAIVLLLLFSLAITALFVSEVPFDGNSLL